MLQWIDNRWHCDGQPIHAGSTWELKCQNVWIVVRVESADQGRVLIAHVDLSGREFTSRIYEHDTLRKV